MKRIFLIAMLLLLPDFLFASYPTLPAPIKQEARDKALKNTDVWIPKSFRERNEKGNCVWASCQTVFWGAAGLKPFEGIKQSAVDNGWSGASMGNVIGALKEANVPYEHTYNRDYKVLEKAVAFGTGAYVEGSGHAVALVGIDDESVRIIDNNGSGEVQRWTRKFFDGWWSGRAVFPLRCHRPRPKPDHPPLNPENPPESIEPAKPIEGKQGPAGPKGDPGPRGLIGLPGLPGKDCDPSEIAALKAEIEKLKNQKFECWLLDENNNVKTKVKFSYNEPLKIRLIPIK